jgi:hypothetical protein
VAAFAESRKEIDREFLETVVAAQGESLEGPDRAEGGLEEELPPTHPTESWRSDHAQSSESLGELIEAGSGELSDNHLRNEILELSERMARLEGLVLDLVGQLVPAITTFFSHLPSESLNRVSQLPPPPPPPAADNVPESLDDENTSPPKKSWWARFLSP